MKGWTDEDTTAALYQGWGLWDAGDDGPEIQRWGEDDTERFDSDEAAEKFVEETARDGMHGVGVNEVAARALAFLAKYRKKHGLSCIQCGTTERPLADAGYGLQCPLCREEAAAEEKLNEIRAQKGTL